MTSYTVVETTHVSINGPYERGQTRFVGTYKTYAEAYRREKSLRRRQARLRRMRLQFVHRTYGIAMTTVSRLFSWEEFERGISSAGRQG